jgi:hypothetical protein
MSLAKTLTEQLDAKKAFEEAQAQKPEPKAKEPNKIELRFFPRPEDGQELFLYTEASEHTDQYFESHKGEVKNAEHKQALIDKARKNAQERNCWLLISQGWHTQANENYRETEDEAEEAEAFYHVTDAESAQAILENGFSLDRAGEMGGSQLGDAIYLSRHPLTWMSEIPQADTIIEVAVSAKIFDMAEEKPEGGPSFSEWLIDNGWATEEGPTKKQLEHFDKFKYYDDALNHLTAWWVRDSGYDGMWDKIGNNLVIWNLDTIRATQIDKDDNWFERRKNDDWRI